MKTLPEGLAAHLESGTTTLCWCWRLERKDGVVRGFTDHDRDLVFGGTVYEAAAGFTASDIKDSVGLSVDNLAVDGALSSASLTDADLAAGLYDDARVEIFRVNWQDTDQHLLMRAGRLGEVRRAGGAFSAEIRGLAHELQQPRGRLYQYTCDADLGDARCRVATDTAALRGSGVVIEISTPSRLLASGLEGFADGWFTRGLLEVASGAGKGFRVEVKEHRAGDDAAELWLWQPLPPALTPGDSLVVVAGCDKHLETCRSKFANAVNFRGFPHMPGNDFIATYSRPGQVQRARS